MRFLLCDGLHDCKTDRQLYLAPSWRQATAPRAANSSNMCDDGIGNPAMVDPVQLQLHFPPKRASSCLFACQLALTGEQQQPRQLPESSCVTWPHVIHGSPSWCHALQPKHSSQRRRRRRRPSALGGQAEALKHRSFDECHTASSNILVRSIAEFFVFLLRRASQHSGLSLSPTSRVAHRQLQACPNFTPYKASVSLARKFRAVFHHIVPSLPLVIADRPAERSVQSLPGTLLACEQCTSSGFSNACRPYARSTHHMWNCQSISVHM